MPRLADRAASRYAREAIELLGQSIRLARIEKKLTMDETAQRAGISRALLRRIERGEPGSTIGTVFEVAAIVGVPLFEAERSRLTSQIAQRNDRLALLPLRVRAPGKAVKDDF
jgi:transcriptional regulator with XRE-family HTH domain